MGHSTASRNSSFNSSKPPTSSQFTSGIWTWTSLNALGLTSFSASLKSSLVISIFWRISEEILSSSRSISGRILRNDLIAASFDNISKSAPTNPWVVFEICLRFTFSLIGIPRVWIERISNLPSLSGIPISISLSNRPGLLNAGSIESGRLVAAITTTLPLDFIPSINVNNWETILFSNSPETSSLFGAMESISSMKIILGEFSSACEKISLIRSSLSP